MIHINISIYVRILENYLNLQIDFNFMIKKSKGKYVVLSEKTGRVFGRYKTKKEAEKRLRQIEFFKHLKASPKLRSSLRKKSLLGK